MQTIVVGTDVLVSMCRMQFKRNEISIEQYGEILRRNKESKFKETVVVAHTNIFDYLGIEVAT